VHVVDLSFEILWYTCLHIENCKFVNNSKKCFDIQNKNNI
jgi:hypothetical protein